jgi:hypothetical protein
LVECIELFKIEVKRKSEASSSLRTSRALLFCRSSGINASRNQEIASKEFRESSSSSIAVRERIRITIANTACLLGEIDVR